MGKNPGQEPKTISNLWQDMTQSDVLMLKSKLDYEESLDTKYSLGWYKKVITYQSISIYKLRLCLATP